MSDARPAEDAACGDAPAVAAVIARPVVAALAQPLRTASGAASAAPLVLIDVRADDGSIGRAYLCAYGADVLNSLTALASALGRQLVGRPITPRPAVEALRRSLLLLGTPGLVDMALAGLDIALWDAYARSLGLPLVRLLGGTPRPLKAYASYGMDGADSARHDAADAVAAGFRAIKIKIGYPSLAEDLAVITTVRDRVGDDVELMVDYNQSLTVPEALRRCAALDDHGLSWIEEPVRYDDLDGHARIADSIRTPIQLGENAWGPRGTLAMLSRHATDLAMLDLMKVGGVSGWLDAAAVCQSLGVPYSDHFYQEPSAHLMALSHQAHYVEFYGLADAILDAPLAAVDGCVTAPDIPGNGIAWDEDAVERHGYRD